MSNAELRVMGLDLSIAATGVADGRPGQIDTTTIRTDPKDYGDGYGERWRRLRYVLMQITRAIDSGPAPALIAMEGPSYGSKGDALHQLTGLWWLAYDALTSAPRLPVAVITPGQLKKYASGNGGADKPDMRMALFQRTGIDNKDNNQVDAWWLAAAALGHLGHPPVYLPKAQRDVLTKVTWPAVT